MGRRDDLEVSAHTAGQFVGQGASIPQVEPERVYRQPEEVRSAPCDERCVELAQDVVGRRPEVRRTDDRGDRLGPGLHPGVTGPRLIVVVEDDSTGTQPVDVRREAPSRIWNFGRGKRVQEPDDVHVRRVQESFREVDERRKVTRSGVVRVQVSRATRSRDEPIQRGGAIVVPVKERRGEVDEQRIQAPRERDITAGRLRPEVPHPACDEIQIVAIGDREDEVRLILEDGRRGGDRGDLPMCLVSPEGREDRQVRHVLHADDELARGGRHLDERVLLGQCGAVEPAENRDAARRGLEDPHRCGGLGRRREDPLRMVEYKRPSLDEIIADRPPVRRQNRKEVRV